GFATPNPSPVTLATNAASAISPRRFPVISLLPFFRFGPLSACADKHRLPHPRRGFCDRACPELAEGMGNLTFIFLLRRVPHPKSRSLRFRACPELVEGVGILTFTLSSIPQSSTPRNKDTTPPHSPSPAATLIFGKLLQKSRRNKTPPRTSRP